jgi:alpha-D-ribose 1-methylphosphonate 5-triphosphate synthase subunit PhnH
MPSQTGDAEIGKGFVDPILGAQRCFRSILTAMSDPGVGHVLGEAIEAPEGVAPAAAMVLLTLADHETPVWLAPGLRRAAAPFVRFHCGAPVVDVPHAARFALLDGGQAEPGLSAFDPGDDRYPDRSATLLIQCSALDGGAPVTISGPGIRDRRQASPAGLYAGFWQEAVANSDRYPLGVDLFLAAGHAILALPRSTRIQLSGEFR